MDNSTSALLLRQKILSWVLWAFYRVLISTWRVHIVESESIKQLKSQSSPWVIAMWHGDELAIVNFCRFYKVSTLVSTSKDGELMNGVLNKLGMATARGSSTRGGVRALKGLLRLTRDGYCPVVPVDGPKGPLHKAKPGVFELSKLLGLPIIPVGVACSHKFVFKKSWNKAFIPLPFAKVLLVWGERFDFSADTDARDLELARRLETSLDAMGRNAHNLFAKI